MNNPTDRELRARWESAKAEFTALKKKHDAASEKRKQELLREANLVKVEWNELLERKSHGILTDPGLIETVLKTAEISAKFYGELLHFRDDEGPQDEEFVARFWIVRGIHRGAIKPKLYSLAKALTKDIVDADGMLISNKSSRPTRSFIDDSLLTWPKPVIADKSQSYDPEDYFSVGSAGEDFEDSAIEWHVNVRIWNGPN